MAASFEWHLVNILRDVESRPWDNTEFALIVLNQRLRAGRVFDSLWRNGMKAIEAPGQQGFQS